MKRANLFALIALVPLALNASAQAGGSILVPLCGSDGHVRMVSMPFKGPAKGGGSDNGCCIKGCHSGSSRKRLSKEIEPAQ